MISIQSFAYAISFFGKWIFHNKAIIIVSIAVTTSNVLIESLISKYYFEISVSVYGSSSWAHRITHTCPFVWMVVDILVNIFVEILNTGLLSLFNPHQITNELLNSYAVLALMMYGLLSLGATFLLYKYGRSNKIALLCAWIAGVLYFLHFTFTFSSLLSLYSYEL